MDSSINIKDLKYQANPDFLPDKTETWKISHKDSGWVLSHNAIRAEINSMEKVLSKLIEPLEKWQIDCIQKWWEGHYIHVKEHHSNEDDIFNPFLRTRINYPEKLETDHQGIIEIMKKINNIITSIKKGEHVNELRELWNEYKKIMFPHLEEEEEIGLPLSMAYFTHKEVSEKTAQFIKNGDKRSLGSFVHWLGGKDKCKEFQKNECIPWFVWYIPNTGFKALRNHYRKTMVSHIDSLIQGRIVSSIHKKK